VHRAGTARAGDGRRHVYQHRRGAPGGCVGCVCSDVDLGGRNGRRGAGARVGGVC
jgi:hypothetical protein